jgi:hypothetical protein
VTDPHHLLEEWLIEGAVGDPPREVAVHAAVCESCTRRIGGFDSLAAVDVGAAGSPPPLAPPTRLVIALAWARLGTAVAGTVVAGILVVFGASQLAGFVGNLGPDPTDGIAAVESPTDATEFPDASVGPASLTPGPGGEPSLPEQTPTPTTFIPLPTQAPGAKAVPAPTAPFLWVTGVGQKTIALAWSQPGGGGPVFKYEIWKKVGGGSWQHFTDVLGYQYSFVAGGLSPATLYRFQVRAVSASGAGTYSNQVAAATNPVPPSPSASASASVPPSSPPTPEPSIPPPTPPPPTPEPSIPLPTPPPPTPEPPSPSP